MIETRRKRTTSLAGASAALMLLTLAPSVQALDYRDAVGSWFGRAVPVAGETVCPAGAPGCPVPREIVMVFTVHDDGTFIGIDSNIFAGGSHSTAHGQWAQDGPDSIRAAFTLLQSSPQGVFIGGFKNLFRARVVNENAMEGRINAFLYSYTNENGEAIVDSRGLPTPSPLTPPEQCVTTPGCQYLGAFTFVVERMGVQ